MTNSQRLATVRAFLRRWLASVPATETSDDSVVAGDRIEIRSESILIREGFYVGRTFEIQVSSRCNGSENPSLEQFRATWFMEQDELKIRSGEGTIIAVFVGDEIVCDETQTQPDQPSIEVAAEKVNEETISIPLSTVLEAGVSSDSSDNQVAMDPPRTGA